MAVCVRAVFAAVVLFTAHLTLCVAQDVYVTVQQGRLRGAVETSALGLPYASFRGVPYAQPPVGELRFQAPQPPASWEGDRDALEQPSSCAQNMGQRYEGSEDCLYVNVFVPYNASGPFPVLTWFPGGAFKGGSSANVGPDLFLSQDIIVVAVQPRVGAMGLLSTGDDVIPGNAGMKDMVMALQWVQQNIAAFGGDPNQVTIGGESSGGCSASHLVLSPLAAGLFRSAIIHSGEAASPWGIMPDPAAKAFRLAEVLGFTANNTQELRDFLLTVDPQDLVSHDDDIITPEEEIRIQHLAWLPVLEQDVEGAFVTEWPAESLKAGRFNKVPVITGFTSGDGLELIQQKLYLSDPAAVQELSDNFVLAVSPILHLPTAEEREEAALKMRDFYFGHENITIDDAQAITDMCTDIYWGEPADATVRAASNHSDAGPIYYHLFDYRGPEIGNGTYGTRHASQSSMVFYTPTDGVPDPNTTFGHLRLTMLRLWSNFIKNGTPCPEGEEFIWEPFDNTNLYYVHITDTVNLEQAVFKERMEFWQQNIPL
ncbi:venom carboxylesterase-6-like [Schistocerca cancellata]|uniref:venom carboxylesterase-6-like n=1 Tax=Schistocerca cancellata TaxID=274614 RepID=UPI002117D356|nr:venom carboxylesterase-6-like [Schistocerca cancellata]